MWYWLLVNTSKQGENISTYITSITKRSTDVVFWAISVV